MHRLAIVNLDEAQSVGVWVRTYVQYLTDRDVFDVAETFDRVDLVAGHRESVRKFIDIDRHVDVLAEPRKRNFHQGNPIRSG